MHQLRPININELLFREPIFITPKVEPFSASASVSTNVSTAMPTSIISAIDYTSPLVNKLPLKDDVIHFLKKNKTELFLFGGFIAAIILVSKYYKKRNEKNHRWIINDNY